MSRARHEQYKVGCCEAFLNLIGACGFCCFIFCPPIPSIITRKFAFHPPEKGLTYRIVSKNESDRKIKNISEVKDEEYDLVVRNLENNNNDHIYAKKEVEVFSVRTSHNNDLVCVRCIPFEKSRYQALHDQVILFCQPNSTDLGGFLQPNMLNFTSYANFFEMDVFAFDYSGFGYSSGTQSERNIYADVRAVYYKILEMYPDKKIVLFGFSIGTTAAVDLASRNPEGLAGVVLVAPFTSGMRLLTRKPNDPKTCCLDSFRNYDKIGKIDVKVLICHGDEDEMIPLEHGLILHDRLKHPVPPAIIRGANHQNILSARYMATFERILRFLKSETNVGSGSSETKSNRRHQEENDEEKDKEKDKEDD